MRYRILYGRSFPLMYSHWSFDREYAMKLAELLRRKGYKVNMQEQEYNR